MSGWGLFRNVHAWATKYKDKGLVVIGVHSPEYSFEYDIENVRHAARGTGVDYPIAIDNHFAIWNAFKNQYSPSLYFVDATGRIRHHHFGAGAYVESERLVQQLLREAGAKDIAPELVGAEEADADATARGDDSESPKSGLDVAQPEDVSFDGTRR